jgi:hypothetical protein
MLVARLPRNQAHEAGPTALHEIEPLVVSEGRMAVGAGGGIQQLADDGDVGRGHVALDLEPGHGGRVAVPARAAP